MKREEAIQALQADIFEACQELTFERLLVARNLVRALVEQQDADRMRRPINSEIMLKATTVAPGLAKTACNSSQTVTDALQARLRVKGR